MKRSKKIRLTRGPFAGEGETKAAAQIELDRQVDAALEGSYDPVIVRAAGRLFVAVRTPWGWESWNTVHPEEGAAVDKPRCSTMFEARATRASVEDSLRSHAAQWAWNGEAEEPAVMLGASPRAREGFRDWVAFQLRYRDALRALQGAGWAPDKAREAAEKIARGHATPEQYGITLAKAA